jgi:hypothetical protein
MPSVFQATTTVPTTTTWTTATVYTAGTSYVQPTSPTGQYFQCTVSGTSVTQPSWSNPAALPVPGQTYSEGGSGPTWTCMGSIIASPANIAVDVPVDTDPSISSVIARGLKNLANNIFWVVKNAGLLAKTNIWTGINLFSNNVNFLSGTLFFDNGVQFDNQGVTSPSNWGFDTIVAGSGIDTGVTAGTTLAAVTGTQPTGLFRIDVYAIHGSSITIPLAVGFKDPATGISFTPSSFAVDMTLLANNGTYYIYSASFVIAAAVSVGQPLTVNLGGSTTIAGMQASISAVY